MRKLLYAASNEQLQAVLSSIEAGITVQVQGGRLLYANAAAARLVGVATAEDLQTRDPQHRTEAFRVFDEAGREVPPEDMAGRQALATGQPQERLLRYVANSTGEGALVERAGGAVRDEQGTVRFAVSAFHDITPLKEAEASLRFLAEASTALAARGPGDHAGAGRPVGGTASGRLLHRASARRGGPAAAGDGCACGPGEASGTGERAGELAGWVRPHDHGAGRLGPPHTAAGAPNAGRGRSTYRPIQRHGNGSTCSVHAPTSLYHLSRGSRDRALSLVTAAGRRR